MSSAAVAKSTPSLSVSFFSSADGDEKFQVRTSILWLLTYMYTQSEVRASLKTNLWIFTPDVGS